MAYHHARGGAGRYNDLVASRKQWQFCSYGVSGQGYPGECGTIGRSVGSWANFVNATVGVRTAAIWVELQDIPTLKVTWRVCQ